MIGSAVLYSKLLFWAWEEIDLLKLTMFLYYHDSLKLSYNVKANMPKLLREMFVSENFLSWSTAEIIVSLI